MSEKALPIFTWPRNTIFLLFFIGTLTTSGQNILLRDRLTAEREIVNCEIVALNATDIIYERWVANDLDSCRSIIREWVKLCGSGEFVRRIIILEKLYQHQDAIDSIQSYFNQYYDQKFRYRVNASKGSDYGNHYNAAYFDFVPLRHPLDSLLMNKAAEILKYENLTKDEKLICILFSGNLDQFETEVKKKDNKESFISSYFRKRLYEDRQRWMNLTIYSGIFIPAGEQHVFSNSPSIGFYFSSPLQYKLMAELGFRMRFNTHDNDFKYYALNDTNVVNSATSIFVGAMVGYKLYSTAKVTIIPKIGIGLEDVDTGIYETKDNSNDKIYHNIKTMHLSMGISAMKPVFISKYLGLEFSYHYCPYEWDTNLHTKFSNHSISAELFFKF